MQQHQQQVIQEMLTLLKQRSKEHPNHNTTLEQSILNSANRQEYLDIVSRLSINKNQSQNTIFELINYAKDSGKYGVPVLHLDDLNKSWEEKMRIYLLDLNKTLKDISEQCQDIWKSFKKIIDSLGAFTPKKDLDSVQILGFVNKIKAFTVDLENNKYVVSRGNPSQTKIQAPNSTPWVRSEIKPPKVEEPVAEPQFELKKQSVSAYSESGDIKGELINLLTRLLSTRSVGEMKIIEKDIQTVVAKKLQYLQLKSTIKFFIKDQDNQDEIASPVLKSLKKSDELESSVRKLSLESQKLSADKEILKNEKIELRSEIQALKSQLSKRIENELKLEKEIKRLEKELQGQRVKFSHLDRSGISMVSAETELTQQELFISPQNVKNSSLSPSPGLKNMPSPASENRTEVMVDVVKKYEELENRLREEIALLQVQVESKNNEISLLKNQTSNTNAVQSTDNSSFAAFKMQELLHKRQIQKLVDEVQEHKATIQQFWLQQNNYKSQLSKATAEKQELKQTIQQFWLEQKTYKAELSRVTSEKEELKTIIQQFWLEQKDYNSRINRLTDKNHELEHTVATFFLQEKAYQRELEKYKQGQVVQPSKALPAKAGNQEYTNGLQAYQVELKLYESQIRKLSAERQELKSVVQQFWLERKQYESRIALLTDKSYSMEESLKSYMMNQHIHKSKIQRLEEQLLELKQTFGISDDAATTSKLLKQQNKILDKIQKSKDNKIVSLEQEVQNLRLSLEYYQQSPLFNADIFEDNQSQKTVLIKLLNEYSKNRILVRTRLLYRWDPYNTSNFHKYIDYKQNIVVLIQTKNAILGGYNQGAFGENLPAQKGGFLFSIDQKQLYSCTSPEKSINEGNYYIVFGSAELMISPEKQHIYSNFGNGKGYYDSKGKNYTNLLKEGPAQETKFIQIQIYQLVWEQQALVEPAVASDEQK